MVALALGWRECGALLFRRYHVVDARDVQQLRVFEQARKRRPHRLVDTACAEAPRRDEKHLCARRQAEQRSRRRAIERREPLPDGVADDFGAAHRQVRECALVGRRHLRRQAGEQPHCPARRHVGQVHNERSPKQPRSDADGHARVAAGREHDVGSELTQDSEGLPYTAQQLADVADELCRRRYSQRTGDDGAERHALRRHDRLIDTAADADVQRLERLARVARLRLERAGDREARVHVAAGAAARKHHSHRAPFRSGQPPPRNWPVVLRAGRTILSEPSAGFGRLASDFSSMP